MEGLGGGGIAVIVLRLSENPENIFWRHGNNIGMLYNVLNIKTLVRNETGGPIARAPQN